MLSINCKGRLVSLSTPVVMGILNVTPDSFYAGSRKASEADLLRAAEKMIAEGATFLDLGGQSTRPGSDRIPETEEEQRVLPAIKTLLSHFPEALVSVDTYYAGIARKAIEAGACLVNDISAGKFDENLTGTVAELRVPYVLMHMKGEPAHMQDHPEYKDPVLEISDQLNENLRRLREAGIKDVIIDPGFGFGKTPGQNMRILDNLRWFTTLEAPLMVGLSRKSTIYKTLGVEPEEALNGTTVLHTIALMNGANILRVHDVREAMQAITLTNAIKKQRAAGELLS